MTETYHRGRKPLAELGAGLIAAVVLGWVGLRWKPSRVKVEGASMAPTLIPGDWALVVNARRFCNGDVVVVEHPGRPGFEMIKRLKASPGDRMGERVMSLDEYWVEGDMSAASTDSRAFGPVGRGALKARVVLVYWPRERRRRIGRGVV
jgi:nickel-type superoxide dismutase maturation protease